MVVREREGSALSLNGEVVYSKELTLRDLLGLKGNEVTRTVGLDDTPFAFEVRNLEDSFLHIASFSKQHPLDSENFFNLLGMAKSGGSSRTGQGRFGIIDDWDVILPEVRARNPRKKQLYDHHKKNVPNFSEFEENHFKKLFDLITLASAQDAEIKEDKFFNQQVRRFISEEALTLLSERVFLNSDQADLMRMTWDYKSYRVLTIEFLKNKGYDLGNLADDVKGCHEAIGSLFSQVNELRREKFQREWYDYLVSRKGMGQMVIDRHLLGEELMVVDKNGNLYDTFMYGDSAYRYWMKNQSFLYGADSIDKLSNGQFKVSKGESYVIVNFIVDEKGIRRPVIKDRQYSPYIPNPAAILVPLIIWQRDKETDEASYFCGQIPQELIQSHPHLFSERHDSLLGQLTVAAYSPKARDQMPKEIKMKGTEGIEAIQQMYEAQSVLLVPMYDQVFLEQSPVILGLEKIAKSKW